MTRFDLVSRIVTAAALVALAVTVGVWLTHAPLTAAPAVKPAEPLREPTLAPPPPPAPAVTPTTIKVPVEVEIAAPADVPEPPIAKPSEPKPSCPSSYQPRRRGLFRRR